MVDKLNKKYKVEEIKSNQNLKETPEGLENFIDIKDNYITNGALKQTHEFSQKLLLVWKISLNLPSWLLQKQYPIVHIINSSVFIFLLALHPFIVNDGLSCFYFSPASSANPAFFASLSDVQSLDILPQSREKSAEMDLGWPRVV